MFRIVHVATIGLAAVLLVGLAEPVPSFAQTNCWGPTCPINNCPYPWSCPHPSRAIDRANAAKGKINDAQVATPNKVRPTQDRSGKKK